LLLARAAVLAVVALAALGLSFSFHNGSSDVWRPTNDVIGFGVGGIVISIVFVVALIAVAAILRRLGLP
jgi:cytochrome bd-type quinol oxidase subunit 2